jgi:hypothetical protein
MIMTVGQDTNLHCDTASTGERVGILT